MAGPLIVMICNKHLASAPAVAVAVAAGSAQLFVWLKRADLPLQVPLAPSGPSKICLTWVHS